MGLGEMMAKDIATIEDKSNDKQVTYRPLGEERAITLTIGMVDSFIESKTKSGKAADLRDKVRFMMLCQARALNPWVGDAYLVGYDSKDGPSFSLITAYQALEKRADMHEQYDGKECGIVVEQDGKLYDMEGTILPKKAVLVGGWCKVYRKDRSRPESVRLLLSEFDQGRAQWLTKKTWMICKCACAAATRKAFPNQTSGMFIHEEMNGGEIVDAIQKPSGASRLAELAAKTADEAVAEDAAETVTEQTPSQPSGRKCLDCGCDVAAGGPEVCGDCAARLEAQAEGRLL